MSIIKVDTIATRTGSGNITLSNSLASATVAGASTLTGAVTANSGVTLGGTTPTLTIGDAGAEDSKIVFDGNAQDFHIGLDDSADSLTIGLGSTLGTTSHMVFDANGHITKPLQSAFLARKTSDTTNISTASEVTIVFDTEVFDQNLDFNNSSGVFTAPVTGKYQLNVNVYLQEIPTDTSYIYVQLKASNNNTFEILHPDAYDSQMTYRSFSFSVLMDMDASDTASVIVYQQGGTASTDIDGGSEYNTSFSGYLAC